VYDEYYKRHGSDRNDLLSNPEVLFQAFAVERANIAALRAVELERSTARVLDVGCGTGASLLQFVKLGFRPSNLAGIDMDRERIEQAAITLPAVKFEVGSAESLPFSSGSFDLVFESTMLGTLESQSLLASIATEMIRVTRPGGYIMLVDWRYSRRGSGVKTAMSAAVLSRLFGVGELTSLVRRERGALVPPLGRKLSRLAPSLYFVAQSLLPFAAGQITTVLKKLH
jgi:SAM-dependent methyltransferase